MSNDREKLLNVMRNLESDYKHGKISAEKYSYFRSKYEDKLNTIDAEEATRKIRSMQGKPSTNNKKKSTRKKGRKPTNSTRKTEQDLVQKYIINPKKGDGDFKEKNPPMDGGTFKLLLLLVLVIGFTAGIAYGIFNFDFETVSETGTVAIVEDTAFPEVKEVLTKNVTQTKTSEDNDTTDTNDKDTEEKVETVVEKYTVTETTSDSGSNAQTQTQSQSQSQSSQSQQSSTDTPSQSSQSQEPAQSTDSGDSQKSSSTAK